ncbi:MAG TPA: DsbA family protein [Roseomonas sp.]|jgi:protein-disulfide isomerase
MRRLFLAVGLCLALAAPARAEGAFTPAQRAEVVEILRQALREDPSILRDAFAAIEAQEAEERRVANSRALGEAREQLVADAADPVRGNARGDVTVVEFFDVRCPYCRQLTSVMSELVRRDGNLRLVMKDLPILGPNSMVASRALLAAQRQGKYGELYDALMALRGDVAEAQIRQEAQRLGLDWARMQRDMADPAIQARLDGNVALARRLGIEGTPAIIIGDRLVPGVTSLETLAQLVAEARAARR